MTRSKQKTDEQKVYFTIRQIAQRWDCSEKHVRRTIERGDLAVHKFGNLIRVSLDDLTRFERMNRMD